MSDTVYEGPVLEYQDFFSPFLSYEKYILPDGIQTVTFKIMSEGDRMKYQGKTNKPININRRDDSASIKPDLANDRLVLIELSVTDWTLMRKSSDNEWIPVVFSSANLHNWILTTDPKIVSGLERAIQKANPWMQAEMSVEDIKKEIADLEEMLSIKEKEELEKNS